MATLLESHRESVSVSLQNSERNNASPLLFTNFVCQSVQGSVKFSQSEYLLSEDDSVFTVSLEYMRALRRNVKIKLILESGTGSSATSGKHVLPEVSVLIY